jgi:hypothetical protein
MIVVASVETSSRAYHLAFGVAVTTSGGGVTIGSCGLLTVLHLFVLRSNTIGTIAGIASSVVRMMRLAFTCRSNTIGTIAGIASSVVRMMRPVFTSRSNTVGTIVGIASSVVRATVKVVGVVALLVMLLGVRLLVVMWHLLVVGSNTVVGTITMRSSLILRSNTVVVGVMMRLLVFLMRSNILRGSAITMRSSLVLRSNTVVGSTMLGVRSRLVFRSNTVVGTTMLGVRSRLVFRSNTVVGSVLMLGSSTITSMRGSLVLRSNTVVGTTMLGVRSTLVLRSSLVLREDSLRVRMRPLVVMGLGSMFTILAVIALKMTRRHAILVVSFDSIIRATIRNSLIGGENVFWLYIV